MMDKAKAYDEALERARQQRNDYQKELDKTDKNSQLAGLLRAGISALEMVFPQLKESDDERVRKDIIDHFESIKSRALYDNQEESDNIISSCNEKIAYLEKQQEASKAIEAIKRIDNYIDENVTNAHDMKDSLLDKKYCQGIDDTLADIARILQDVYSGEKQKEQESTPNTYGCLNCTKLEECEKGLTPCSGHRLKIVDQKPADDKAFEEWIDSWFKEHKEKAYPQITMDEKEFKNFCRGIRNMYQQKSDWNEEDERMLSRCIKSIECSKKFADSETYKAAKDVEINWLKDISLSLKKHNEAVEKLCSNEWTEEDGKMINTLVSYVGNPSCWNLKCPREKLVAFIESLPKKFSSQSKQEWSEEDKENR